MRDCEKELESQRRIDCVSKVQFDTKFMSFVLRSNGSCSAGTTCEHVLQSMY